MGAIIIGICVLAPKGIVGSLRELAAGRKTKP